MNNIRNHLLLFMSACLLAIPSRAQTYKDTLKLNRPVTKVYKFNDNLFWGLHFSGAYSMSENVRKQPFMKMVGPGADFEFGKHLNRQLAARVMLGYRYQLSSCPQDVIDRFPDAESYNFNTVGINADLMFCLDRLFTKYSLTERHQFWLFGGIGGMLAFGYSGKVNDWASYYPIDTKAKMHPAFRAGLEWHWKVSNGTSFVLRGLYGITNNSFGGKPVDTKGIGSFAELSLGFNVHLGNRYGQRHFEYCGHNANRYFNVMNQRLAKMHKKANKQKAKLLSKQTDQKVLPETNLCEQDTILLYPIRYSYLTDMQKSKLRRMANYLAQHPDERAHIHIYPDEENSGTMEMEFRVTNRLTKVEDYLSNELKVPTDRYIISPHPTEMPPYSHQHIFTLGGIIRYEKMDNTTF